MPNSAGPRQTRSGHVFSPYATPPLVVHTDCDLDALLTTACLSQHKAGYEDLDHYPVAGPDEDRWESSPLSSAPPSPEPFIQSLPDPPTPVTSPPAPLTRQERSRLAKKTRRCQKRRQQRVTLDEPEYAHRPSQSKKFATPMSIPTNFKVETLPVVGTGFVSATQPVGKEEGSLQTLLSEGFRLQEWDGW